MFIRNNKGQPIVEYVVLVSVIIAAVLIGQMLVRQGYLGRMKSAADDMGEQFSASGTTIKRTSAMEGVQTVTSEVATDEVMAEFVRGSKQIKDKGAYSLTERAGGKTTMTTDTRTDAAKQEAVRWEDLPEETFPNYDFPSGN